MIGRYAPIFKGVKECPHCGNDAYFGIHSSMSYKVTCTVCGCSGPVVDLPTYWSKGNDRLMSRLYQRAVKPWNFRGKKYM